MKKLMNVLAVLIVVALSGFMMAGACEDAASVAEDVCGPCGTIENGDATITGMASLDGVFKAVGSLKMRTGSIKGNFDTQVRAMAEDVFGLDVEGKTTAEIVGDIETAFKADIKANIDGELTVKYEAPKCEANLEVAVSAQAQCEAKVDASCEATVECDPGELSVSCEGKCEGSCSGECSVPTCQVELSAGDVNCSAECRGSCTAEVSGECEGTCNGSCDGKCSAYASTEEGGADAECAGQCDGTCEGSCTVEIEAECEGTCHGECVVTGPEAEASCEGDLGCEGTCDAECTGGCEGSASAPKCSGEASCDADVSAKCEAQASAQASAELTCTPPSLAIDFNWEAGLDANAKAEVLAKLNKFKVAMVGIIQGWAELKALVEGSTDGDITIEAPVVTIKTAAEAFLADLKSGDIEVEAVGLVPCAIPAFEDTISFLGSAASDMKDTLSAQVELMAILSLP